MKIRTFFHLLLLCLTLISASCKSSAPGTGPASVEDAEKQLAKQAKEKQKIANKAMKEAKKHYWAIQSKSARKSIKENEKRQKRVERAQRKSKQYNYEDQERWGQ